MKWFLLFLLLAGSVQAVEKISPDPKAVELCTKFLQALLLEDETARLQAVMPLLHPSMYSNDKKGLAPNVRDFSYKKACGGVKFYAIPAEITEVHQGKVQTISVGETAERGRIDKYFVAKAAGQNGMPAPLHVFWPENGGPPVLVNIGSL